MTAVALGGERKAALTNVGVCPTFGARKYHAETFIPDYEGDLYGRDIRIEFLDFLREERVFSSPEELKKQINVDILTAKERFFAKKQASEREDG